EFRRVLFRSRILLGQRTYAQRGGYAAKRRHAPLCAGFCAPQRNVCLMRSVRPVWRRLLALPLLLFPRKRLLSAARFPFASGRHPPAPFALSALKNGRGKRLRVREKYDLEGEEV